MSASNSPLTLPSTPITDPPFDDLKADIIVRSAGHVDFRMFKSLLSFASSFFDGMFSLPQSLDGNGGNKNEMKDGLAVIQMAEDSETIRKLLMFCHPGCAPVLQDLQQVQSLLDAALKYDMQGVAKRIGMVLTAPHFIDKEPLRVFAIASRHDLEEETLLAARHTLRFPIFPREYVPELEGITAGTLHRLEVYHQRCGSAANAVATGFGWISLNSFIHFGHVWCRICSRDEIIKVSDNGELSARKWWVEYMQDASTALQKCPCGATVTRPDVMNEALKKASQCSICRASVFTEMKEFTERFAAEVEAAVSTITLQLNGPIS